MKHWIQAARLRTLPLSVSGILVGSFYAMSQAMFNWKIVIFALTTTLGFQILSNFANDYGDGIKGTDNNNYTKGNEKCNGTNFHFNSNFCFITYI